MILKDIRKVFVLGDLHLGVRNNSIEWSEIQSTFLLDFFIKKVDEEGFDPDRDILVQVGDWNHVRESTNVRIHNASLEIAKAFCEKFKRGVYVILGNHDVYYKDRTDTHSLKGYDLMFKNFKIFEKPDVLQLNTHKFLMLPWIEDLVELKAVARESRADFMFCHADFKGSSLNKVTKLEHGLEKQDTTGFKRVYSGHIHIRQESGNFLYVGTPYEMDRGDRDNTKGFYVLDVSKKNITEKFIENTVSPRHKKFDVMSALEMNTDQLKQEICNNFIDLTIESEFSKRFPLTRFVELIREFGHRRLEFFPYSIEQKKAKSEIEINSNYEYNIFSILDEHLKVRSLSPIQAKEIREKFKEVYDSLKNTKNYDQ